MSPAEVGALVIAGIACAFDLRSARIPNALTFPAAVLGVLFHAAAPSGHGADAAALGLLTGLAAFFPIFALGAMGAGDVKLMAALGAWIGWYPAVYTALYGSVAGGVLAVGVSMAHGYLGQAMTNIRTLLTFWWLAGVKPVPTMTLDESGGLRLPYALPIAIGLVVTLWLR